MASSFLFIIGLRGKIDPVYVAWTDDTLVLIMQEYLLRSSVKETCFSPIQSEKTERLREAIDKRSAKLRASVGRREVVPILLPIVSSWWHRYLALQPDCSDQDAFNDSYVSTLHSTLLSPGSGEDPILSLVKHLQANEGRTAVVIDSMDASLLAAMWEIHRRESSSRSAIRDIFLSASFYPVKGISTMRVMTVLRERFTISSTIMIENILVCLPLILHAGLPPLLMLQCSYKDDPLAIFMSAVSKTSSPILRVDDKGSYVMDVSQLICVFEGLAKVEEEMVQQIDDRCREQTDETAARDFCGAGNVGWGQFRQYYYYSAANTIETESRMRVVAYLAGLLQLSSVYRGISAASTPLLSIRMEDAPLVADILSSLKSMSSKGAFVGLPSRTEWLCGETTQKRRTLGRLKPIFSRPLTV